MEQNKKNKNSEIISYIEEKKNRVSIETIWSR